MKFFRLLYPFCFCLIFLILFSCSGGFYSHPNTYIHPNTNFRYIKKVAVMPFANLTNDKFAGDKVRNLFVTQLLSTGTIDVVELGELLKILELEGIRSTDTISTSIAQQIGRNLDVQAIILGSVDQFDTVRSGQSSFPEVALTLRMIEVETGTIIWTANHNKSGKRILASLFGIGTKSINNITTKIIKEIVDTLVYEK